MSLSISVRSTWDALLNASRAAFTGACFAPPLPKMSSGAARQGANALVQQGSRQFSHTSAELLAQLRLGWNLGNSLDVPDGETAWGNPRVAAELLRAAASAGFGLVRIPVTWAPHTGPAPDYVIEPLWFQRVDQVVGYARSAGLSAIINLHHDGADGYQGVDWLRLKNDAGETTEANNAAVRARFVALWTQIAEHFSGAGEELLFESMNEIHDGYGTPDPRHFSFINDLNQAFVNLVRQSGGNNAERHLIVPGYNTNIDHTLSGFKVPTDSALNRLILSVHYYDPYLFALQAKVHTWGKSSPGADDWGQEDDVLKQFDKLKSTFIDHGLPVLIGEYGATYQPGFEDYRRYYLEYVTKAAVARGMLPVYWDNGGHKGGAESFGLIDRQTHTVLEPKLMEAMLRAAKSSYSLRDIAPPQAAN